MRFKVIFVLIVLLVSIALSSGIVSATLIVKNVVSTHGNSYRAANDTIGINVTSSSNVSYIGPSGNIPCTKTSVITYVCVIHDFADSPTIIYQMENADGDAAVTNPIKVDNGIDSINYTITNYQNSILLDYSIQDSGFSSNNACSGISSIKVYDGNSVINTVDINGAPGTCDFSGTINLSIGNSGTKSFALEATDNVGNKKRTAVQNVTLDLSPPEIITGLIVKYSGTDDELHVIGGSASFLVDIYFSVREDNLKSITLDLSGANTNPAIQNAYSNLEVPLNNCVLNDTITGNPSTSVKVYDCVIKGVPLRLSGNVLNMNVVATDMFDSSGSAVLTKSFTVDSIEPKVSIKTDRCDSAGRCYVSNGNNKIIFSLNKQNFAKRYLFFNIPESAFGTNMVQNCSGNQCTSDVSITRCTSGSPIEVSITSYSGFDSQDDAGNIVSPYSTYLYCDNDAPVINDVNITGESSMIVGIGNIASGSTITIKADITEDVSDELIATAYFDKMKNSTDKGTCTKIGPTEHQCVWTVTNIQDGYYEANIMLNVSDIAGNNNIKIVKKTVFGFKSDNETPNDIGISFKEVIPSKIDRVVVDMATSNAIPYYVYSTYVLSVVKDNGVGKTNVSVLRQTIDIGKCNYVGSIKTDSASTVFSEIKLSNPYGGVGETGRIDFRFRDNLFSNSLDNEFTLVCNVSVYVKEGNKIYKKPQNLELRIPFVLTNTALCTTPGTTCTPGEVFGKKIADLEDNWLVKSKLLETVNSFIPKLQQMCKIRSYLSTATQISNMVSIALNTMDITYPIKGVGSASSPIQANMIMSQVEACLVGPSNNYVSGTNNYDYGANANQLVTGNQMTGNTGNDAATRAIQQSLYQNNILQRQNLKKQCDGVLGDICEKLNCDVAAKFQEKNADGSLKNGLTNEIPDLFANDGSVGRALNKNINVPDVSNSIYMAISTGCYPAMYYHLNKFRQVDCNYLYCLKMASYTGTDISACDKAKYAQTCGFVVGELFELGGVRQIKNYMNNAADLVRNSFPLATTSLIKKALGCDQYIDFSTGDTVPPTTITGQSRMIYVCQVPLQIARFVDMTSRSASRGKFTYPVMPDMCNYAKCVGEQNCVYEPDMMDMLSRIKGNYNTAPIPKTANEQKAIDNKNVKDANEFSQLTRTRYLLAEGQITPAQATAAGYTEQIYNTKLKSLQDRGIFQGLTPADPAQIKGSAIVVDDSLDALDKEIVDVGTNMQSIVNAKSSTSTTPTTPTTQVVATKSDALTKVVDQYNAVNAELTRLQAAYQPIPLSPTSTYTDAMLPNYLKTNYNPDLLTAAEKEQSVQYLDKVNEYKKNPATSSNAEKYATIDMINEANKLKVDPNYDATISDLKTKQDALSKQQADLAEKAVDAKSTETQIQTQSPTAGMTDAQLKEYNANADKLKELEKEKAYLESEKKDLTDADTNYVKDLNNRIIALRDCLKNGKDPTNCASLTEKAAVDKTKLDAMQFGVNSPNFDSMSVEDKVVSYNAALEGLKELDALDKKLGSSLNDPIVTDKSKYIVETIPLITETKPVDGAKTTPTSPAAYSSQRMQYWEALGLCGGHLQTTCEAFGEKLSLLPKDSKEYKEMYTDVIDKKRKEANDYVAKAQVTLRDYQKAKNMGNALQMALQFANAKGLLNWMFTDFWTEKWFKTDFADYLDADKWKDSLCNPTNPVARGGGEREGSIISCSSGNCLPVLTYATERTELQYPPNATNPDGSKYNIYSVVYYISSGDIRARTYKSGIIEQNISFNIYFKGPSVPDLNGYKDDIALKPFEIKQVKNVFKSQVKYTEMCVKFSIPFPFENSITNKDEYCRPITEKIFDNGTPWSPENSTQYVDEYDANGNRIKVRVTNVNDVRPPGALE